MADIKNSKGEPIAVAEMFEVAPEVKAAVSDEIAIDSNSTLAIVTIDRAELEGQSSDLCGYCDVTLSLDSGATWGGVAPTGETLVKRCLVTGGTVYSKETPEIHAQMQIAIPNVGSPDRKARVRWASPCGIAAKCGISFQ